MLAPVLSEGARTVAHLSVYLEELKAAAGQFATGSLIAQRGYFRPDEEAAARQLQVSYWQSRRALLELVDSIRLDESLLEDDYSGAFLVGFAGALLLVDCARFLRENFHTVTPIRRKLDEADLQFDIPARMYDTVQKSLTSPRHAWHLYHAVQYFTAQEPNLRQRATDPELAPAMEVIDRLRHRLDVPWSTYARTRLRVRGRRLAHRLGRDLAGRALYGIQKLVSSMMADVYVRRGHRPSLPEAIREELFRLLAPGDVLIVRKEHALTNYFLPGYWPHAALYLGQAGELSAMRLQDFADVPPRWRQLATPDDGEPRRVLEAMKDGVRIRGLSSPFSSDSLVVVRPQLPVSEIARAIARGLAHEGKPYDFDFDFSRADRLVCTEVVFRSYDGIGGMQLDLTRRAGRNTLAAGDLVRMVVAGRNFSPVTVFSPAHAAHLLTGDAALRVLRQAELGEADAT